jgi:hypothetical protein
MITKSIRLPEELLASIVSVEQTEHIEEAAAIRKLIRIGLERYVGNLYEQGQLTLREAATQLHLSLPEAMDCLLAHGVTGNLGADDTLHSFDSLANC